MEIERERVDGLLRGAVGGLLGLVAMRLFLHAAGAMSPVATAPDPDTDAVDTEDRSKERPEGGPEEGPTPSVDAADDIHIASRRQELGQAVQWGYGVLVGGLYGATRTGAETPDVLAGLGYGTALWAVGDELVVPLLGLAASPTSQRWSDHATTLGAHLAYGAATSTATQALKRVM